MFTNVNPLTHRKIEKAFTPIQDYTLLHTHSALRPPHMFAVQPHVYAISSERISDVRGGPAGPPLEDSENSEAYSAFHQYVVTDGPDVVLTPEQAMEVDAARALEELAVAGRMGSEGWHGQHDGSASGGEGPYPRPPNYPSPGLTSHVLPPSAHSPYTPLSEGDASADERSHPPPASVSPVDHQFQYYRDPNSHDKGSGRVRRRTAGVPIPVPHLTKPSRGRRVPTAIVTDADAEGSVKASPPGSRSGTSSPYGTRSSLGKAHSKSGSGDSKMTAAEVAARINASARAYVCKVEGCGKAFRRGEHLKRHVRSLHTHEKPERCTFPGCGKEFSRKDNMQQHLKIHDGSRFTNTSTTAPPRKSKSKPKDEDDDDDDDDEDDVSEQESP